MTKWMIRGALALSLLVFGLQGEARAQGPAGTTVDLLGFVGAATDDLGTTFGGGINFGATRWVFSAEVGYLTGPDGGPGVDVSALSVDFDAQYRFAMASNPKLTPYLLAGLGVLRSSVSTRGFDASDTDTGFNLGGGLTFQAGAKWKIRPEVKFWIHDDTATRVSVAAVYPFGR